MRFSKTLAALFYRRPKSRLSIETTPRSTALYIGRNRLLVGTTIGPQQYAFYLEADDRLLTPWFALTGRYENDVTDFFLRNLRPDSHCMDLGTNFGYFLCLMARSSPMGRTLGVEPDSELSTIAQDNLFLNGVHEHSEVIRGAVADQIGELTLHRREFRSGNTSVIRLDEAYTDYFNEPAAESFVAPSFTIDALADRLGGRVDFIKIDVEGAEPLALAGAIRTVAGNPGIAIVMEWSPGQIRAAGFEISDLVQRIAALELKCFTLTANGEAPLPLTALETLPYQSSIILRRTLDI